MNEIMPSAPSSSQESHSKPTVARRTALIALGALLAGGGFAAGELAKDDSRHERNVEHELAAQYYKTLLSMPSVQRLLEAERLVMESDMRESTDEELTAARRILDNYESWIGSPYSVAMGRYLAVVLPPGEIEKKLKAGPVNDNQRNHE